MTQTAFFETAEVSATQYADLVVAGDWTAAIEKCIEVLPAKSDIEGQSGGTVRLPSGLLKVSKKITVNKAIVIEGAGAASTLIVPSSGFTDDVLFDFVHDPLLTLAPGAGVKNLIINMQNTPAVAIRGAGLYDNILFENVRVVDVNGTVNAFRFIPSDGSLKISQTMTFVNVYARSHDGTGTVPLYYFEQCQEVVLENTKAIGSYGGSGTVIGTRPGFQIVDSRGFVFIGCSVAFCKYGFDLQANARDVNGVFLYGTTVESCNTWLRARGLTVNKVRELNVSRIRLEGGGGGCDIDNVARASIDYQPVTLGLDVTNFSGPQTECLFISPRELIPNLGNPAEFTSDASYAAGRLMPESSTSAVIANFVLPTHWSSYSIILIWTPTQSKSGQQVKLGIHHGPMAPDGNQTVAGSVSGTYVKPAPEAAFTQTRTVLASGIPAPATIMRGARITRFGDDSTDTLDSPVVFQGLIIQRNS